MDLSEITINENTNCSSLIVKLIIDYYDIPDKEKQLHLLRGMGKGVEMGSICGAITGGIIAINLVLTKADATEDQIQDAHITFRQAFYDKFLAINCSEILDLHFDNEEFETRQQRFCGNLIDKSTKEVIEIINLVASIINPISLHMNRH